MGLSSNKFNITHLVVHTDSYLCWHTKLKMWEARKGAQRLCNNNCPNTGKPILEKKPKIPRKKSKPKKKALFHLLKSVKLSPLSSVYFMLSCYLQCMIKKHLCTLFFSHQNQYSTLEMMNIMLMRVLAILRYMSGGLELICLKLPLLQWGLANLNQ